MHSPINQDGRHTSNKTKRGKPKKLSKESYRKRSTVERFFSKIKIGCRRIILRYERLDRIYRALVIITTYLFIDERCRSHFETNSGVNSCEISGNKYRIKLFRNLEKSLLNKRVPKSEKSQVFLRYPGVCLENFKFNYLDNYLFS